jgi:hypothetical protein
MATVRITGTTSRNIHKREWLGAPVLDPFGRIERALDLPESAYQRIEEGIARGVLEGILFLDDGRRVDWFVDRGLPASEPAGGAGCAGSGEGI